MEKIRKIMCVVLAVIFAVSLMACGSSSQPSQGKQKSSSNAQTEQKQEQAQSQPAKQEQKPADTSTLEGWGEAIKTKSNGKTINLAFATHPATESMQKMTADFEKLTGIKVNWKVVEETQLKNDQLMDFTGKSGNYDLYMVDGFWIDEYGAKDVLLPLDDYLKDAGKTPSWFEYDDIVPAYRDGISKYQGKTLGIPIAGETRFVGYRKDLFEKYQKQPPKTMDEYLELAKFFNGKESGLYGVAMRAQKGIHCASGWMTVMYNFGGEFINQKTGEPTMTKPETIKSLKFFVDLLKNAPPDVSTYTHEEAVGAFMSGKAAMWLDATAIVPWIMDTSKSKVYDKVDFVPTPAGPAGKAAALAGWNISIPNTAKNKDEAWAFAVYMLGKPNAKTYVKGGGTAVRASVFKDAEMVKANPSYPVQLEALDAANELVKKGIKWIPPHEKLGQILDIVGGYANNAIIGQITPEKACEAAQKDLEDLLK